ncbi:ABC transporter permease subunit [Cohnella sp. CFH 77786]|uniref:ABC transporter permease n=1 Tax=Cohnella sp. CFH 77786 TaxID=2662265 RepID=UPI001C60DDF1|nr:ABC transporter permease [Cohnella sp. CFH 77786]MBW5445520.1 ABC transporter permease subunit [Cohnella sp. CFH 77786]
MNGDSLVVPSETDKVSEGGVRAMRGRTPTAALRAWARTLLPLLAGAVFLLAWQAEWFHSLFRLKTYQLPLPSAILQAMSENGGILFDYARYTLAEAVLGMLAGSAAGFLAAWGAAARPRWGAGGLLMVASLNAVPIVALAPIMNLWFGDGIGARIAIVAAGTTAAMAINAHKGMTSVDPLALDLMHACAATKRDIFFKLRMVNSLPYVFTALKINATSGMIGAIVGEFFFSSRGLGYLLSGSIKVAKMPLGWACIVVAAASGILLYGVMEALERTFIRWHPSRRR